MKSAPLFHIMHWVSSLAVLWLAIYIVSLLTAFLVRILLPVSPFVASMSGLLVGLIGILYTVGSRADQRFKAMVWSLLHLERPEVTFGNDDDFESLIEELQEEDSPHGPQEDGPSERLHADGPSESLDDGGPSEGLEDVGHTEGNQGENRSPSDHQG